MAKKKTTSRKRTKHISHDSTHIFLKKGLFVYAVLIFLLFILVTLSAFALLEYRHKIAEYDYRQTAWEITNSLGLENDGYTAVNADVTYTSSLLDDNEDATAAIFTYGRNSTRSATFASLEKQLKAAGFTKVGSELEDTVARQDVYENSDEDTVSISVTTAAWNNARLYGTELPDPNSTAATEDGPSYVAIEVEPAE